MYYEKNGITYKSNLQVTEKTDLEGRLYIRKERADEIIQRLLEQGFIRENNELTLHE